MRTAIQLHTLREEADPLPSKLRQVGETALDGVEFAGLDADPTSIADALDQTGLEVAGAHVPIDDLEADPAGTVAPYRHLGCETVVVPYLADDHFRSQATVRRTAARLDDLAAEITPTKLAYHNHDHEFQTPDSLELLVGSSTDLRLEVDVGWVLAAGLDPVSLLDRTDRVTHVHLKDVNVDSGTPVELGDGDLDIEACARAADEAGAEWLIYEHDNPVDPMASLTHGAAVLSSL